MSEKIIIIGVIPARWASSRFEGKVLADILGKPMIQHVWERAKESRLLDHVIIACDDERIQKAAKRFGAEAVMTSKDHPSGTDRIAEAVRDRTADVIINIQGDEPLIRPAVIDQLAQTMIDDSQTVMATVIKRMERKEDLNNPNVVKVVVDQNRDALYFSRSAIPHFRDGKRNSGYKHLGLYAYRKDFLLRLKDLPPSSLEESERLEQLRVLEAGYKIKTVETEAETIGVDTPEDLNRILQILKTENRS